jgi:ketosteroid isomerase-like protein
MLYSTFGDLAFMEAYLYDNTEGGDYYGAEGDFSYPVTSTFRKLKRFWNIPTDIQITDAHGSIYKNVPMVTKLIQELYFSQDAAGHLIPVDYEEAHAVAKSLKVVFGSKRFLYYNHPLFTFNAFADPGFPALGIPKKIVMGDGILKALADLGYGGVGPQSIVAHEHAHHIQFANKYFTGKTSPEATRRTELMADAYAAYFLTHEHGAAMNERKVHQFLEVFYAFGDCSFKSNGHHGTPNQRKKAALFGSKLAANAQDDDAKLTSQAFDALFEAALPTILLPDAL